MTQNQLLSPNDLRDRDAWRKACTNLFFFATNVGSQAFQDKFQDFGKMHLKMCYHLDTRKNPNLRKYMSVFRGGYKTTVLLAYFVWFFVWNIVKKQSNAIIYNTATKENAWNFQADIKHFLLENELLQWIFPELPHAEKDYKYLTKNRIENNRVRIDFGSLDTTLVSRHFSIWVNDDMENDENSKTEYMREDLIRKWKYQKAILTKVKSRNIGTEIEVGTPYHVQGLTWKIRNSPSFDRLEIPCYIDRDKTKGVSFPERYTVGDFEEIAKDLGPTIFSAQYLLNALAEEDSLCPEKWIRYWDRLPENRWRTLVIDPGGSGSSSDPTGVTVVDTDENGILYVVHADEYRFTPMELINHIDEWKRQYRPDDIRIEKDRYATTIADMFVHKFPLLNVSYVEHGGRGKEENRIWRLKQWFENKRILIGRNQHNFRQQLLEYPSSKHDDMLDSLAYHLDIRRTPAHKKRMYLPSGKEFFPNVTQDFSDEMDAVLRNRDMKSNEEARYNDTLY
ncbi:MAG: hypothetical protein PHC68_19050 [Syntrophorhabdaceae bacterium]|nr:hypothetical protein [Syntrophorhabdaceae bacterium]